MKEIVKAADENYLRPSAELLLDSIENDLKDKLKSTCVALFTIEENSESIDVIRTISAPMEAFKGGNKKFVSSLLEEIVATYPKPRVHKIKNSSLVNVLHRIANVNTSHHCYFYPFSIDDIKYVFLAFIDPNENKYPKSPDECTSFLPLIAIWHSLYSSSMYRSYLSIMELFAKEIGHDFSIQTQTIVSKLDLISSGRFSGELAKKKASEAKMETIAALRIADFLGVSVERNYQLREKKDFDLVDSMNNSIRQYEVEADERHIRIKSSIKSRSIRFWGDKKAIELAIGQLLMNAIKYSYGNSFIEINITSNSESTLIIIKNKSPIPLLEEEQKRAFDFGWRSPKAKELHVNGSGIGLFTVMKIANAHLGACSIRSDNNNPKLIITELTLPSYQKIKDELFDLAY